MGGWTAEDRYALRDLGHTLLSEGRYDLARNIFAGLVATDPSDGYSRFALGVCYRRLNEEGRAVAEMEEALRADSSLLGAAVHLAEIHFARGEQEKARRYASMAEALGRGRPAAAPALARLRRLSKLAAKRGGAP